MNQLRTLKKLLFGETWVLPLGLTAVAAAGALIRPLSGTAWAHVGGFVLLAGVVGVLVVSVGRGATRR